MTWLHILQYIISQIFGGLIGFLSTYSISLITERKRKNWKDILLTNLHFKTGDFFYTWTSF